MATEGATPSVTFVPPDTFDDYEIVRPLGRGGMGTVYLGRDAMLDRPVALKFIAAAQPAAKTRERFLNEARAIARLQHPNVVGIYRIGEVAARPYLAYEFVDGKDLHEIDKPLHWSSALTIAIGLARGLSAAHRRGVLHRDLKPANVVVTVSGEVKLLDFGLAKMIGEVEPAAEVRSPDSLAAYAGTLTSAGALAGTPLYMAPELWRGEPASVKSDVYALGLLLYELVAGEHPRAALRGQELIDAIQRNDLPPLEERQPDAPTSLCDLIDRCTRRQAFARPASAEEVRDALEGVHAYHRPFVDPDAVSGGAPSDDAARVGESFARVLHGHRAAFAPRFYERLFARAPGVRSLFPTDMTALHKKVVGSLDFIVRHLKSPVELVPMLEDLGRRHAAHGVQPQHFEEVASALLGTLEEFEGEAWTPSLEGAWRFAYSRIAQTMVRAIDQRRRDELSTLGERQPTVFELPVPRPRTRHVRSGERQVAYQTLGQGPIDVVALPGVVTDLEAVWQEPGAAATLRRLSSFARLIALGGGMERGGASLEDASRDLGALLDAEGCERAFLWAVGGGAALAAVYAATFPDRVRGLLLAGGQAGAVGDVLPLVEAPVLLLHRRTESAEAAADHRELVTRLPRAREVALDGDAPLPFGGDGMGLAAAIEGFVLEPASPTSGTRVLGTVLAMECRQDGAGGVFAREAMVRGGALVDLEAPEALVAVFDGPSPARDCADAVSAALGAMPGVVHPGECRIDGGATTGPAIGQAMALLATAQPGQVTLSPLARALVTPPGG